MSLQVKVKKWGSSLAVLIPGQFAKMNHIQAGSLIKLDGIEVVGARRRYKASDLMREFKAQHRHGEVDIGDPVGKEVW
jgi:antitoxin component of MazEF toxin-antitoxin module